MSETNVLDLNSNIALEAYNLSDDSPVLIVKPALAKLIGLNEAIVYQQIRYWVSDRRNKNIRNALPWVYKTHKEWQEEFPFWSISTIRRTIKSLNDKNLILINRFNEDETDSTNWYTICKTSFKPACGQVEGGVFKLNRGGVQLEHPTITEITTEITNTKTNNTQVLGNKEVRVMHPDVLVFFKDKKFNDFQKAALEQYGAEILLETIKAYVPWAERNGVTNHFSAFLAGCRRKWKPNKPREPQKQQSISTPNPLEKETQELIAKQDAHQKASEMSVEMKSIVKRIKTGIGINN